jgi:hypothetical protein
MVSVKQQAGFDRGPRLYESKACRLSEGLSCFFLLLHREERPYPRDPFIGAVGLATTWAVKALAADRSFTAAARNECGRRVNSQWRHIDSSLGAPHEHHRRRTALVVRKGLAEAHLEYAQAGWSKSSAPSSVKTTAFSPCHGRKKRGSDESIYLI